MPGRLVSFLCGLLIAPAWMVAQQTSPSTVDDLVRMGLAQNRDVLSIRERIGEAQGAVRQAGVRPPPTINANGVTGKPLGTLGQEQYGANYSQPLETFGKRSKRIEVAGFGIGQAEAELQERSAELAYQIRSGVAERVAEQQKLKLLDDLASVNQDALRLTEARVHEGDVAPLEASLLRVEINRGVVLKTSAQGRLAVAETNLRKLVGLRADQPLPQVTSEVPGSDTLEELKSRALQSRADLRSALLRADQNRAGIALAKANAKPDVTLSAGYSRQYSLFEGTLWTNIHRCSGSDQRTDRLAYLWRLDSSADKPERSWRCADSNGAVVRLSVAAGVPGEVDSARSGSCLSALDGGPGLPRSSSDWRGRAFYRKSDGHP